jgi:acyl-coenzyme A thioesterase PaaI-like protein
LRRPVGNTRRLYDRNVEPAHDYLQPAIAEQDMRGFAECYKRTRNLAFVRGIAYHEDRSNPIANFTACFMSRSGNLMPGMEWPDK